MKKKKRDTAAAHLGHLIEKLAEGLYICRTCLPRRDARGRRIPIKRPYPVEWR
jgi:hypothetical protein